MSEQFEQDDREALVQAIRDSLGVTPETIALGHIRPGNSDDLADAILAAGFRRSPAPQQVSTEALWDFADDLLDAWGITDENPPSMTEQFRDMFAARFRPEGGESA